MTIVYTQHYNLAKDSEDEFYSIERINENLDKIDEAIHSVSFLGVGKRGEEDGSCSFNSDTNNALGENSTVFGVGNNSNRLNFVCGKYAKLPSQTGDTANSGDLFVIGNGTGVENLSNAFRVAADGSVNATKAYSSTGADYAEMFEWLDGNPNNDDRVGRFVTLYGEKIQLASYRDSYVLGVVSAEPSVIGDAYTEDWREKYEKDIFGRKIKDKDGNWILNKYYDQNKEYIPRINRSEWDAVGMVGKLVVIDDGSCKVNGYCKPHEHGIATFSEEKTDYRVISRLDRNHIKILIKG